MVKSVLTKEEQDALDTQDWIRKNPKAWMRNKDFGLGIEHWWEGMDRMTDAFKEGIRTRKPVVIGSGHALSKDFTVSGGGPLWFLNAYGPKCQVAMTAPTDRQVRKVMWAELTARYKDSVLKDNFGRLLTCNLEIKEDWYCLAFTTKETGGSVGKFQGFHASATMVIISEAQAVHDDIYEQIDGILTSEIVLFVLLGNPVRTTGKYAAMLRDKKNNIVLNLSCHDSPNVISGREDIPGMCGKAWVEDKEKRWNKDKTGKDPRYMGRVLGLVPTSAIDNIISDDLYDSCVKKNIFDTVEKGSMGVDPARFGDDDMVIKAKKCGETIATYRYPYCDAVKGAGHIVMVQKKHFPDGQIPIVIDCDGVGGPYLDNAKHMTAEELEINFIEYHGSCNDKKIIDPQFANQRAEAHFFQKTQMEDGKVSLPEDDELAKSEATECKYFHNLKGKIQIEEKKDLKETLGHSPNDWDAEVLATWGMKYSNPIKKRDSWRDRRRGSSMVRENSSAMGA